MDTNSEIGILFLHHKVNPVVLNNLKSIREQNADASIVTISAGETLPGGYSLSATKDMFRYHNRGDPHLASDILVCSWFLQRKFNCEKWWIVEWDTYCSISIRDYYKPVWNYDFIAATVHLMHREKNWPWFRFVKHLPEQYRRYAMGAVPFLYLLSNKAVTSICESMIQDPFLIGNSELRFATLANKCGYPPCGYSPPGDQISWFEPGRRVVNMGIYHPVKHLVQSNSL